MNNYWVTNFNADQRGEFSFTYSITSGKDKGTGSATRFGWGKRIPMPGRVLPAGKKTNSQDIISLININQENILLVSAQPYNKDQNSILLHLRETSGKKTKLDILNSKGDSFTIRESDVLGNPLLQQNGQIIFKPWEVKFILLTQ